MFEMSHLSDIPFANIFSQSMTYSFYSINTIFSKTTLFLFFFSHFVLSKKFLPIPRHKVSFYTYLSLVLHFNLKFMIYLS